MTAGDALLSGSFLRPRAVDTLSAHQLSPELFQHRYRGKRPVLLRGLISKANLMKWSSPHFLAEEIIQYLNKESKNDMNSMIEVLEALDKENFLDNEEFAVKRQVTLESVLNGGVNEERFYYRGKLTEHMLQKHVGISELSNKFFGENEKDIIRAELTRIWISTAGCVTPLHYDRCHGLLVQLSGEKRFVLQSPEEDGVRPYPCNGVSGPTHLSRVRGLGKCFSHHAIKRTVEEITASVYNVLSRWPEMSKSELWVVDLSPGDVLYTPPGFYHEVTSISNSVSITLPFDMNAKELLSIPAHMII
ncbi:uncharacterized protein VTP21DRAFT_1268 [Calcarisporiella thermophila]|uniref:uncharacterized protein n=1 Tax=Calcarisporiella thermophila TaxID=911321 RepID=UPI0037434F85